MWEFGEVCRCPGYAADTDHLLGLRIQVRERLVNELSPHIAERPIHEIILLARRCKVKKWLIDAYTSLVREKSRADLLGLRNEGIDTDTIANLFFIREETGSRPGDPTHANSCPSCLRNMDYCQYCGSIDISGPTSTAEDVSNKINEIFASEFAGMVSN